MFFSQSVLLSSILFKSFLWSILLSKLVVNSVANCVLIFEISILAASLRGDLFILRFESWKRELEPLSRGPYWVIDGGARWRTWEWTPQRKSHSKKAKSKVLSHDKHHPLLFAPMAYPFPSCLRAFRFESFLYLYNLLIQLYTMFNRIRLFQYYIFGIPSYLGVWY